MINYVWLLLTFVLGYTIHWLQTIPIRSQLAKSQEKLNSTLRKVNQIEADLDEYMAGMDEAMQEKKQQYLDLSNLSKEILDRAMATETHNGELSQELLALRAQYERTLSQFN